MPLKVIIGLKVKSASDTGSIFKNLRLTPGSGSFEFSDKRENSGVVWTAKVSAKLIHDDDLLHGPCILQIQTPAGHYIIGTPDLPAFPAIKEEHLVAISLEYKSKSKPQARK